MTFHWILFFTIVLVANLLMIATELLAIPDSPSHTADVSEHTDVRGPERIEAPSWLARTRHEWALMLLRRNSPGDRESAESLLAKALDAAGEFGCRTLERRVSAAIEDPDRAIA